MSEFNFKITEDDRPGGGVYKLGAISGSMTIRQSDYPGVDLSKMTANNFFLRTTCGGGGRAVISTQNWMNVNVSYYGGSVSLAYSYRNGTGTVTVSGSGRRGTVTKYPTGSGGSYQQSGSYGSYSHTLYMSKDPIR